MGKQATKQIIFPLGFFSCLGWSPRQVYSCMVSVVPATSKTPVVSTTLGKVQGVVGYSRLNMPYYQYLGIPYAEAPVGKLRFEAPVPFKRPWREAVRQTNKWGSDCLQFDALVNGEIMGQEDCLFLNIFTPKMKSSSLYPVLIWIHGGGFTAGSSKMYDPKYFMDAEDMVVVTMNYRLGALGFLNTGDHLVRGNMGLKDQNMALRFVRDNIANFGGDPSQVTIFGQSAGAASAHYHVISPLSKGLFQRAIMQSGNVFSPWAYTRSPQKQALEFGHSVGCPTQNTFVLVDCLKKMDGNRIVFQHSKILSPVHTQNDFFAPSTEPIQADDTLIPENPFMMLNRGDFNRIPVIFGINSGEGALKTARLEATPRIKNLLYTKWNEYVPILLHYNPARKNISSKIRQFYFPRSVSMKTSGLFSKRECPSQQALQNFTRMISDGIWFHATKQAAVHHAKFAPVFLNYFSYMSDSIPFGYITLKSAHLRTQTNRKSFWWHLLLQGLSAVQPENSPKRFGVCHGDDLVYFWSLNPLLEFRPSSQDYAFSRDVVAMLSNFVKGEPQLQFQNVTWEAVDKKRATLRYMNLGRNSKMINQPFPDGVNFIDSLNIRNPLDPNNW